MGSFGFPSFFYFFLMVRGFYDGAGSEAFFCLLAVVL